MNIIHSSTTQVLLADSYDVSRMAIDMAEGLYVCGTGSTGISVFRSRTRKDLHGLLDEKSRVE